MAKFHINDKGNAGACSASAGQCPFAADTEHYPTPQAAREAYEAASPAAATPAPVKKPRNKNFVLLRTSSITGKTYVEDTYGTQRQLNNALREKDRYLHHSSHFYGASAEEAMDVVEFEDLSRDLKDRKADANAAELAIKLGLSQVENDKRRMNEAVKARAKAEQLPTETYVVTPQSPQDFTVPEPTVAKEGGVIITPEPYGKPSKDAFFHPLKGFDRTDMNRLIKSDEYLRRHRMRHDEIMDEMKLEAEELRKTPAGQEQLSAQSQERYRRRVKNAEARTYHGRGDTYYYVSKSGAIRETHTNGAAAIPRSSGFGMESSAQAHRDVVVGELQAHGFRKKDALEHLFNHSSGALT